MKIFKTYIIVTLFLGAGVAGFIFPISTHAGVKELLLNGEFKQTIKHTGQATVSQHPAVILLKVINVAITFLGVIVIGLFCWAGYLYMTAGGKAENVEIAQHILLYAVIGAFIVLASFGLTIFVFDRVLNEILTSPV
ncbi:MAG: hypothetical protein Q8P11_04120 [bacterium]|nr:hypothetical protein [bacterium]